MRRAHWMTVGTATLSGLAVLAAGCAPIAGGDTTEDVSCAELEEQSAVEFVLCDDGDTRIDRRDRRSPATPEAERVE